jgi:transposase-like protein
MNQRKHVSPEQKVMILRELLENQVPLSDLSEKYGVHPNVLHRWKKELFEGAVSTFARKNGKVSGKEARELERLTAKLKQKDELIAELVQDNIELKKSIDGEI